MTTALRRRLRHARRGLGYGVLVVLIFVAVLVGVANQVLPLVERHPEKISAWLSARVGEPVTFTRASAEWTRRGPRFTLDGLHVGGGETSIDIGRAQLQVAMYSGLLPGHPLTELRVRDLSLTLVQEEDGRWRVVGLPGQGGGGDPLDRLEGFGELQIEKAQLLVHAAKPRFDVQIPRVDVRLRVDGPRLRVGASAWIDKNDLPVSAVLDFHRPTRDGTLWIGGKQLVLTHWTSMLASVGIVPRAGRADLALWAKLHDRRPVQATLSGNLQQVQLDSADALRFADGTQAPAHARFERIESLARWTRTTNGWQLDAPRLNFISGEKVASLGGLRLAGGERLAVDGKDLDLSPLAAILSLSDRLPSSLRVFLQQTQPLAVMREVAVQGSRDGHWQGSLVVSGAGFKAHGNYPGFSGLSGRVQLDERGAVMRLAGDPIHFDWPAGLRKPEDIRLDGTIGLWKSEPGWTLGSDWLHLQGEDFGVDVRTQLGFQGNGSAPTLDLAASLDPANVITAKKFWIMHKMPASAVKWLDAALVSGQVQNGRIAIGGDLDDWPFRDHSGSFDARATVSDATLKFDEHWPAGEHLNLDVAFDGPGFSLDGNGMLEGNRISHVGGGIEDFHTPWLKLAIDANGPGEKLRKLMIASPLNADYGEHLKAATVTGDAEVALALTLPLEHELGQKSIDGTLDLRRARLADSRWDVSFTEVDGRTRFTDKGFATQDLKVRFEGQPGVFNLRVGDFTGQKNLAATATLDGRFGAPVLLKRYPDLAWLKPWITGTSDWKLAVNIPAAVKGAATAPAGLRLNTDLVGTVITLPAPLNKAAPSRLPMELSVALPVEQGEVNLRLGDLMRLRGQIRKNAPMNGVIQFGGGAMPAAPGTGLSVRGNVPTLDAGGWIAFSGKGDSGSASAVHDIDVQAARLDLVDRPFPDTRLQLSRGNAITQIKLKGTGIDGSVDIPNEIARGVQARFAKLYLVSPATATAGSPPPSSVEVDNPASLPALRFSIADLRLGQAQLGQAELVTTPIANGMRVEKFQSQAKALNLNASGEWVRAAGGTRSNFRLDFTANSLGQMLDTLGFAGMVQGARTQATLSGSWPGSPGAFSLSTMSGSLKADLGEGRLLDVEPGGSGRVLGLISLTEVPRRLLLDFSDVFAKGFAFNSAHGNFLFNDGKARTDNLRIDGPAAEIRISGTTDMRGQAYDQRVEVLPKASGVFPAIGMLAGGPAGVAVGAVAQIVLRKPLKQTTRVVYHVTGPWQKPQVVVIEKGPARGDANSAAHDGP